MAEWQQYAQFKQVFGKKGAAIVNLPGLLHKNVIY